MAWPTREDALARAPANDQLADCRDCGFAGTWVTADCTCPQCGGRDLILSWRDGR